MKPAEQLRQEFLALLSRATTLPISYDLETLERSGSRLSDPISVKKFNIKVADLLRSVLTERSLDFVIRDQQLLITPSVACRLDFVHHVFGGNHVLAIEMPTPLG